MNIFDWFDYAHQLSLPSGRCLRNSATPEWGLPQLLVL